MRDRLNCPNCGAPIVGTSCPYCGSVFYDFVNIDGEKPTFIRMRWNGQIITMRAAMQSATITQEPYTFPEVNFEFAAIPDNDGVLFKCEGGEAV